MSQIRIAKGLIEVALEHLYQGHQTPLIKTIISKLEEILKALERIIEQNGR